MEVPWVTYWGLTQLRLRNCCILYRYVTSKIFIIFKFFLSPQKNIVLVICHKRVKIFRKINPSELNYGFVFWCRGFIGLQNTIRYCKFHIQSLYPEIKISKTFFLLFFIVFSLKFLWYNFQFFKNINPDIIFYFQINY